MQEASDSSTAQILNSTHLKNGLFDIIVQDSNHVMTTINARY